MSRGLNLPAAPVGANFGIYSRSHFRGSRRRHRWLFTVSLVLFGCTFSSNGAAEVSAKNIHRTVIICEDSFSSLTIRLVDARLRSTLEGETPHSLELYIEYASRVLAGATILFREPTLWGKAKFRIIFVLVGLVAETCLLFFLVWLVRRNGRAQQAAERRLALEEISHLNRVASMGRMAASLVHELSQPLAAILSNAQAADHFASRPVPDLSEVHAALADIAEDNKRARAVMNNMRAIFQKHSITCHEIDLNEVVSSVARLVSHDAVLREVELRFIFWPRPLHVQGDEIPLQQVVLNLITNGMDAMNEMPMEGRSLTVITTVDESKSCGAVTVEDNGPGIPENDGPKLFTPFFTTKSDGLGMGLSISQSIVQSLGGRISFSNRPRRGALFQVQLPLAKQHDLSMTA